MGAPKETVALARRLRRNLSPPAARLWSRLRARKHGMSHDLGDRPQRDATRDAWLKARGLTVTRIASSDAMRNAEATPAAHMGSGEVTE